MKVDIINNPPHYGGVDNPYETIKVIRAWGFEDDFYLGNVLKYISRAEHKGSLLQDLKKAFWYLDQKIKRLEEKEGKNPCPHLSWHEMGNLSVCAFCGLTVETEK